MEGEGIRVDSPEKSSNVQSVKEQARSLSECAHVKYQDFHCAVESCWNYYNVCPKHAGIFPNTAEKCSHVGD